MIDWQQVLASSTGIAGGPYTKEAEGELSELMAGAPVRLTTSGTDALEVAALLSSIRDGDVVVVPSFGFVTTALAFVRAGARIRFVDIEPFSLGIDPEDLALKLDPAVRAVVPIHYAGYPCDVKAVGQLVAATERALMIEDNAHGLFGSLDGIPLGTFGSMSCLSFHGTKNVSSGEGGAIVINDRHLVDRAEIILEKGTDRQRFVRGEVDKYTWHDLGSSFGLSDYLAAVLVDQLAQSVVIQSTRRALSVLYSQLLEPHAANFELSLPGSRAGAIPAYHLFYVVLPNPDIRDSVVSRLRDLGVGASTHYPPLHQSPGGRRWGEDGGPSCPNSERIAASIVRLPLDHRMAPSDVERSVESLVASLNSLTPA